MNAPTLHLLLLFPFVFSEVGPLGKMVGESQRNYISKDLRCLDNNNSGDVAHRQRGSWGEMDDGKKALSAYAGVYHFTSTL